MPDFLARARAWRILNPDSLLTHANGECEKLHVTNKFVAYFYTYVSEMRKRSAHACTHACTRKIGKTGNELYFRNKKEYSLSL